jgi:hypothetical protein
MSNLKLVPDEPTPLEKLLLDASRAEMPSEDHKAKLRAMLGIGLPISGPASVPPASATVPAGQAAGGGAAPSAAAGAVAATKSATLAKVALGVAAVGLVGAFMFLRSSTPVPQVTPARVAPAEVVVAPVVTAPAAEAAPAVSPLPPVEQATPATASHVARTDSSAAATADLSEQIRLIEAARSGVAAHDSKAALAALDSYSAKFPRGSFGQEALVLRIRAVDQAGDSARATAMAKSFVARFPNSPHVARLKPIAERGASR